MSGYLASIAVWPVTTYYLVSGAIKGGPGNPTLIQGLLPPVLGYSIAYYFFGSPFEPGLPISQHVLGYLATGAAQDVLVKLLSRTDNR
jgi:hypothetical protein